ncbi:MAG: hypothetical protein U1F46_08065 [Marinagarivorans sp.]
MFNANSEKFVPVQVSAELGVQSDWRWFKLPLVGMALMAYAYIYSADVAYVFILNALLLMMAALVFCLYHKSADVLSPAKIFTVLYCASFALLPFWLVSVGGYNFRYIKAMVPELMNKGSEMALMGYLFFLAGYFISLGLFSGKGQKVNSFDWSKPYISFCYLALLSFGILCFLMIFYTLGGVQHFTAFKQGRADLLVGVYGGYFWGMHLLISGYCIFCVKHISRSPVICLALAVMVAGLFSVLQGRDMVVAPFFCWLVLFDGFRRSISFKVILLFLFVLMILSSMIGAVRSGEMGGSLGEFVTVFFGNALLYFAKLLAANIEQFDTAMAAIKHADIDGRVGIMVLMSWFEPIDRALFGNSVNSINSGVLIDLLLMPEHKGWNTAASPSIIGELYLAFKWLGIAFGMLFVGIFFALLSIWYDRRQKNSLLFAAYPFVLYVATKMIVDGFQHGFRGILIFVSIAILNLFKIESKRSNE